MAFPKTGGPLRSVGSFSAKKLYGKERTVLQEEDFMNQEKIGAFIARLRREKNHLKMGMRQGPAGGCLYGTAEQPAWHIGE